jgi:hypothetical protein
MVKDILGLRKMPSLSVGLYGNKQTRTPIPNPIKTAVIRRQNNCCKGCRISFVKVRPHFHHIDQNPNNHKPENIQALCAGCHDRVTERQELIRATKKTKRPKPNIYDMGISSRKKQNRVRVSVSDLKNRAKKTAAKKKKLRATATKKKKRRRSDEGLISWDFKY